MEGRRCPIAVEKLMEQTRLSSFWTLKSFCSCVFQISVKYIHAAWQFMIHIPGSCSRGLAMSCSHQHGINLSAGDLCQTCRKDPGIGDGGLERILDGDTFYGFDHNPEPDEDN